MSHQYPKAEKLKSRIRITEVFTRGRKETVYPLRVYYLESESIEGPKVKAAVSVSKRNFRLAVDRNRVKRLMRESYRRHKSPLFNTSERNYDLLFLYLGKELPSLKDLDNCMVGLIDKLTAHEKSA